MTNLPNLASRFCDSFPNFFRDAVSPDGAEAASRHYFKKSASNLTREEAAFLAAMIPSPLNVFNPTKNRKRVVRRQRVLLKYMNGVKLAY